MKKNNAVDIARILIGASVCAIAKLGPRYTPMKTKNKALQNKFISTESTQKLIIPIGRHKVIAIAGTHP